MVFLALLGYTSALVTLVMLYLAFEFWRKIANGHERIMWHNKWLEGAFLAFTLITIVAGTFLACFERPDGPGIYPYQD